jgi:hypothetical protein
MKDENKLLNDNCDASDSIPFELVENTVFIRWYCHVCRGCTEKVSVLCEAADGSGLRVCESCLECLEDDADFIDRQLAESANGFERQAKEIRALIGRLRVPTYQQWLTRVEEAGRRMQELMYNIEVDDSEVDDSEVDDSVMF